MGQTWLNGKFEENSPLRTFRNIQDNFNNWQKSGGKKDKAKVFSNCIEKPLLYSSEQEIRNILIFLTEKLPQDDANRDEVGFDDDKEDVPAEDDVKVVEATTEATAADAGAEADQDDNQPIKLVRQNNANVRK